MATSAKSCKIYYGDGSCSIEGDGSIGIILRYSGDAIVKAMANDVKWVLQKEGKILIMSMDSRHLTNLFPYSGTLNIISAEVTDGVTLFNTTLHRIDNYSELINTKAEDLTTISEELSKRGSSGVGAGLKEVKYPTIDRQDTETHDGKLYLENGRQYHGRFHVHTRDGSAMTGAFHIPESQLLYTKPTIRGKFINKLIPTTTSEARKIIRMEKKKMRSMRSMKKIRTADKPKESK